MQNCILFVILGVELSHENIDRGNLGTGWWGTYLDLTREEVTRSKRILHNGEHHDLYSFKMLLGWWEWGDGQGMWHTWDTQEMYIKF